MIPYTNLVDTLLRLIPSNIVVSMYSENIVGVVIFSALVGIAANRMEHKNPESIQVFKRLRHALYIIVMSIAMTIIKYMPYAVVALLARTVISNGVPAIIEVSSFVAAVYIATVIMLMIHLAIITLHGVAPSTYLKKAAGTWLLAFTSRSSVGTLPMTISTLTRRGDYWVDKFAVLIQGAQCIALMRWRLPFIGLTVDELGMMDFIYAPPFARTWEIMNVAGNVAKS